MAAAPPSPAGHGSAGLAPPRAPRHRPATRPLAEPAARPPGRPINARHSRGRGGAAAAIRRAVRPSPGPAAAPALLVRRRGVSPVIPGGSGSGRGGGTALRDERRPWIRGGFLGGSVPALQGGMVVLSPGRGGGGCGAPRVCPWPCLCSGPCAGRRPGWRPRCLRGSGRCCPACGRAPVLGRAGTRRCSAQGRLRKGMSPARLEQEPWKWPPLVLDYKAVLGPETGRCEMLS